VQNLYHAAAVAHRDALRDDARASGDGPADSSDRVAEFWRLGTRLNFNLESLRAGASVPK